MITIILCYALLASTFTIAKAALVYAAPFFLIGVRMSCAGFILLLYRGLAFRDGLFIDHKDYFVFFRVAFFHVYLAFILEFWALQYISSAKTSLLYALTPFIAAVLSYILLGEQLSRAKTIGLIFGFFSMTPLLIHQGFDRSMVLLTIPEIVLLIAITSAAYAWFDIQKLMRKGYSLLMINGFAMAVGGVCALITSYICEGWHPLPVVAWVPFIKTVGLLIFISNILFYNLFGSLLRRYTITFLTFIGFLTPIFASLFGWLFLHERITWHYGVSLFLLVGALAIFNSDSKRLFRSIHR